MLKDVTFGQYFEGNSFVHKLDPRCKILLLIATIVLIFCATNFYSLGVAAAFIVFVITLTKIPIGMYLKNLKAVLPIIIFTGIINLFYSAGGEVIISFWRLTITVGGVYRAIYMASRIVLLILVSAVLTYTTTPNDLTDAIESLLSPLRFIGLRSAVHTLAMMMTIALRFIPTLVEETQKIMNAQKARGVDFEKALEIKKVQEETKKDITVTFNLRFHPFFKRVKELIKEGTIGKICSIHYEWLLDTSHGADYFHRWHCIRENSGSLLIHKSSHHFDIANWFLEEEPIAVNAFGTRRFYGTNKEAPAERCIECPEKATCKHNCGMDSDTPNAEFLRKLYLECESEDGYLRDRCVYSDRVDIEDSVSLNVMYSGGAIMSYTLTAHSPYEGVRLVLNGTKGRIEMSTKDLSQMGYDIQSERSLKIFNYKGEEITMNVPLTTSSDHGGADIELRDRMFRNKNLPDPLNQMADMWAGLMATGIGMAANVSMKEGRQVSLSEFYEELRK